MTATKYWTTDRIMNLIVGIAIAACVIYLLNYLYDVLLPFFAACFIAYLLQPLVSFNKRLTRCKGLGLPAVLTVVDVTVVAGLVVTLFLPSVIDECNTLNHIIHNIATGQIKLPAEYASVANFLEQNFNHEKVSKLLSGIRLDALLHQGSSLLSESLDALLAVLSWLLTLIYVIFILIYYPTISNGIKLIIPHKFRSRGLMVIRDVESNMNSYFRGQGLVALCAMVFYCTGFSIVGLPLAIPMGLLVGILYMIPYFQYVTVIPVAILCFIISLGGSTQFLPMLGRCALVYVVSQSVCDYVITPHVMGRAMGMNPAVILLSLSVWGALLGIIGMIIALPVSSIIMTYYEKYISNPAPKTKPAAETP